jgi:hypothetical protein
LATVGGIYTPTDLYEEFMKYAAEMGMDAMIHIRSLTKTGLGSRVLIRGGESQTYIRMCPFSFFRIRNVDYKQSALPDVSPTG